MLSQAALKALEAVRTYPLVYQYQKALNDVSARHVVRLCPQTCRSTR